MKAIVSEKTDEKHEALRAAYENIREGWPPLWNPNEAREWRVECPKCKGGNVDEIMVREYRCRLFIQTTTYGVEEIRNYENAEEATRALEYQKREAFEGSELKFVEEDGVTNHDDAVKFLDEHDMIPNLEHTVLLPNGVHVKTEPDAEQVTWGHSAASWEEEMCFEQTYQTVCSEDDGWYSSRLKHFQCEDCGYKTKSLQKVLKSKRRK